MWPFENDEYPEGYVLPSDASQSSAPRGDHARRHGPAVLHYHRGEPFAADNVLLPDRSRGKARLAPQTLHWRRPLNDRKRAWGSAAAAIPIHWRWGALIITSDDLVFEDNQSLPELNFDGRTERLDRDLCQSPEIREVALTMEGCNALYTELRRGGWLRISEGQPDFKKERDLARKFSPHSKMEAATTLANIRRLGETSDDFLRATWLKHYHGYRAEYLSVRRQIKRLGWYDALERPEDTAPPEGTARLEDPVHPPNGFKVFMRELTIFVVVSMLAVHILVAAMAFLGF